MQQFGEDDDYVSNELMPPLPRERYKELKRIRRDGNHSNDVMPQRKRYKRVSKESWKGTYRRLRESLPSLKGTKVSCMMY